MQSTGSMQSYEITNGIFQITRTKNSTIHMETQKAVVRKKNGAGGINLPDFRLYSKAEWSWGNQSSWLQTLLQSYCHKDSMGLAQKQKYRPMDQDREPRDKTMHLWVPLFAKRGKYIQCRKDSLFNKLRTLNDINQSNILYDTSPRVMDIGIKINKWDLIKLKSFWAMKETISKLKRQPSEWENNSKRRNWQRINLKKIQTAHAAQC